MEIGSVIGHYEVISLQKNKQVGLCRHVNLGVVRIIKKEMNLTIPESDVLKRLDHRRIPSLIDKIDGQETYLIVDHIKGNHLKDYFHMHKMTYRKLLNLMYEITSIFEHIHCMNVIHGDMKPEHVIVNESGCHLIDFGSSFIERDSGSFTMDYVAPERLLDTYFVDERSDIYSIGKVFQKMLKWYCENNKLTWMRRRKLEKCIHKCLMIQPDNRFNNVQLLKDQISRMIIFH